MSNGEKESGLQRFQNRIFLFQAIDKTKKKTEITMNPLNRKK